MLSSRHKFIIHANVRPLSSVCMKDWAKRKSLCGPSRDEIRDNTLQASDDAIRKPRGENVLRRVATPALAISFSVCLPYTRSYYTLHTTHAGRTSWVYQV